MGLILSLESVITGKLSSVHLLSQHSTAKGGRKLKGRERIDVSSRISTGMQVTEREESQVRQSESCMVLPAPPHHGPWWLRS